MKESGVSSGVRRIEAICGKSAVEYIQKIRKNMKEIEEEIKNRDIKKGIEESK